MLYDGDTVYITIAGLPPKLARMCVRFDGVDTLIFTGTLTNGCCEATARDAMQLNFKTNVVADANGARNGGEHNATLVNMIQFFADVRFTDEVVGLLEAETPAAAD